ncbi:hypothetical protein B0I37DRAFT_163987 [Chaetomium sp. MPI-CAGE-AT-0009]|nr:hypothetical protein B0I37DRAFT_163987 [Chaetomium sp. MPI-CAGE-AT-0009]
MCRRGSRLPRKVDGDACAQCGKPGHTSGHCVMPNRNYGSIMPCPACNTKSHHLDSCPETKNKPQNDREFMTWLTDLLLVNRGNRPQIRSTEYTFYDVLAAGVEHGYVEANDLDVALFWPWSNDFARKIGSSKPGDEILQGKLHPSQFDHAVHDEDDLPEDPLLCGKTMRAVLDMRDKGLLDADRFVPASQRTLAEGELTEAATDAANAAIRNPRMPLPSSGHRSPRPEDCEYRDRRRYRRSLQGRSPPGRDGWDYGYRR